MAAEAGTAPVYAFGANARRWAARLRCEVPVIVTELPQAADALAQGLELRRAGERFFVSVYFEDRRDAALRAFSRARVAGLASPDELRVALDGYVVTELPASAARQTPAGQLGAIHNAIVLAHGVLARSGRELGRLRTALGVVDRESDVVVCPDDSVPLPIVAPPTDVVVWAPDEQPSDIVMFAVALQDLQLPVTIVAAAPAPAIGAVRFVGAADGAAALGRARAIVDGTPNDPGTAVTLARLGRPLAVAASGGASEYVQGTVTYDRWSRRSILAATATVLGLRPPRVGDRLPRATVLRLPEYPAWSDAAPLVSIVIPTRDRREMLDAALRSIDAQRYPAIETIVVNDAGNDVGAVVARHPSAKLIVAPEQRGPSAARNLGLQHARGEFVLFFDDDDEMLPYHVAALVDAAERAQLDVAYGQMLTCYLIPAGPGRYVTDALHAFDAVLDHADIQWGAGLAPPSILFRRTLLDEIGPIDESLRGASDYEFWIRLVEGREAVRVPHVTALYNWRVDGSNTSGRSRARLLESHRQIYAKHPTTRPLVIDGRREFLEDLARQISAAGDAGPGPG